MLRAKKAEWQEQMVISLIPAFNFRLNMGFRLKPHAVCTLRSLCQVLLQLFTLSPQPSHCCQPCEHPLSWRFGARAAGGCPWPLLTMGRSSWAAFMSCGDGGCPGSLWGSCSALPNPHSALAAGGLGSTWWCSLHNTQTGALGTRLQSKRPCSAGGVPFAGGCVML